MFRARLAPITPRPIIPIWGFCISSSSDKLKMLMKINTYLLVISIIFTWPQIAAAELPVSEELLNSVFMLSSVDSNTCATAFTIEDGTLVTNSHVLDALCKAPPCRSLVLRRGVALGGMAGPEIAHNGIKIIADIRSLDFALVKIDTDEDINGVFRLTEPKRSDQIASLGFEKCKKLTLSRGKVLSSDSLYLYTSTRGKHGVSGSPVFRSDYSLAGVVDEASSINGALLSTFFGKRFYNRAVRAEQILNITKTPLAERLLYQAETLWDYYQSGVSSTTGSARFFKSMGFMDSYRALREELLTTKLTSDALALLNVSSTAPDFLPRIHISAQPNRLTSAVERISLAASLEYNGPYKHLYRKIDLNKFKAELLKTPRSEQQVELLAETVRAVLKSGYMGIERTLISWLLKWLPAVAFFLVIWGASLGYVFAVIKGSILKRLIASAVIGLLLWPLSFFLFLIWTSRRKPS
ncbi:MAG: serine protease [Candidatus Dadabacteria bacterium]|nr:MAG: serine protease [Candidatus Dadabacteria bacterium]